MSPDNGAGVAIAIHRSLIDSNSPTNCRTLSPGRALALTFSFGNNLITACVIYGHAGSNSHVAKAQLFRHTLAQLQIIRSYHKSTLILGGDINLRLDQPRSGSRPATWQAWEDLLAGLQLTAPALQPADPASPTAPRTAFTFPSPHTKHTTTPKQLDGLWFTNHTNHHNATLRVVFHQPDHSQGASDTFDHGAVILSLPGFPHTRKARPARKTLHPILFEDDQGWVLKVKAMLETYKSHSPTSLTDLINQIQSSGLRTQRQLLKAHKKCLTKTVTSIRATSQMIAVIDRSRYPDLYHDLILRQERTEQALFNLRSSANRWTRDQARPTHLNRDIIDPTNANDTRLTADDFSIPQLHAIAQRRHTESVLPHLRRSPGDRLSRTTSEQSAIVHDYLKDHFQAAPPPSSTAQEEQNKWWEQLQHLLANDKVILSQDRREQADAPWSTGEIKQIINHLTATTAPGVDGIPPTVFQHPALVDLWAEILTGEFNSLDNTQNMPTTMVNGIVRFLPKPGRDPANIGNYRPITLLPIITRMYCALIAKRLNENLDTQIHHTQLGFVPSRRIEDATYTLQSLLHHPDPTLNNPDFNDPIFLNLDLKSAFDAPHHAYILRTLDTYGYGPKLNHRVGLLLNNLQIRGIVNDTLTKAVPMARGTPQGSACSPALFLYCLDPHIRMMHANDDIGLPVGVTAVCFADDSGLATTIPKIPRLLGKFDHMHTISGMGLAQGKSTIIPLAKTTALSLAQAIQDTKFSLSPDRFRHLGTILQLNHKSLTTTRDAAIILGTQPPPSTPKPSPWPSLISKINAITTQLATDKNLDPLSKVRIIQAHINAALTFHITASPPSEQDINTIQHAINLSAWPAAVNPPIPTLTAQGPPRVGGLGLGFLRHRVLALATAQVIRYINGTMAPTIQAILDKALDSLTPRLPRETPSRKRLEAWCKMPRGGRVLGANQIKPWASWTMSNARAHGLPPTILLGLTALTSTMPSPPPQASTTPVPSALLRRRSSSSTARSNSWLYGFSASAYPATWPAPSSPPSTLDLQRAAALQQLPLAGNPLLRYQDHPLTKDDILTLIKWQPPISTVGDILTSAVRGTRPSDTRWMEATLNDYLALTAANRRPPLNLYLHQGSNEVEWRQQFLSLLPAQLHPYALLHIPPNQMLPPIDPSADTDNSAADDNHTAISDTTPMILGYTVPDSCHVFLNPGTSASPDDDDDDNSPNLPCIPLEHSTVQSLQNVLISTTFCRPTAIDRWRDTFATPTVHSITAPRIRSFSFSDDKWNQLRTRALRSVHDLRLAPPPWRTAALLLLHGALHPPIPDSSTYIGCHAHRLSYRPGPMTSCNFCGWIQAGVTQYPAWRGPGPPPQSNHECHRYASRLNRTHHMVFQCPPSLRLWTWCTLHLLKRIHPHFQTPTPLAIWAGFISCRTAHLAYPPRTIHISALRGADIIRAAIIAVVAHAHASSLLQPHHDVALPTDVTFASMRHSLVDALYRHLRWLCRRAGTNTQLQTTIARQWGTLVSDSPDGRLLPCLPSA